jgi:putative hydrolase of the HAD superfamily
MIRAIFFDMGGTLDGRGHWLNRFAALYEDAGLQLGREHIRGAFDDAERRAAADDGIQTCGLEAMVDKHVAWQIAHLGVDRALQPAIVGGFVAAVRRAAADNARVLADLSARGLKLAVVSNGCGNVDVICSELGYAPYLSAIVDSRRVGLYKPDPAIFILAAARIAVPPAAIMMVGDSFDRDVRPARSVGMMTAWIADPASADCPEPSLVDVRLDRLSDLAAFIENAATVVGAPRS